VHFVGSYYIGIRLMYSVSAPFFSYDVTRDGNPFSYRPSYNELEQVREEERGVTEESNPKSQARHVLIDSLFEH
jgi:hypothetical protein